MANNIIKVEPWGGNGGGKWYDGSFNGVRKITIRWGDYIDSITVVYDKNGRPVTGDKHGGSGGKNTDTFELRYPDEYLTGISGKYCTVTSGGTPVINCLRFESNQRTFGHFGRDHLGTSFSISMDGASIVGFLGKSAVYLDSIGFVCAPINNLQSG